MQLSQLQDNQTAYILHAGGSEAFVLRLAELGFVPGQEVTRLYASPVGTPIVFSMLGQRVALRRSEAERITIALEPPATDYRSEEQFLQRKTTTAAPRDFTQQSFSIAGGCTPQGCAGCSGCGPRRPIPEKREGTITIGLVGNPNCGKTTFFNAASGGHERTGNYAGVTVSSVVGERMFDGRHLRFVDLPGTYSLDAYSPEEAYVLSELQKGEIDVVLNVLDVTNLERNLLLTLQLQQLDIPLVGVLNMWDEFEESQSTLDIARLETHMNMPFVPVVASRKQGVLESIRRAVTIVEEQRKAETTTAAPEQPTDPHRRDDPHALVHHYLEGIYHLNEGRTVRLTAAIDRWLAKSGLAYVAFFAVMWLVFYATFTLGAYPMDWMDAGVAWLGEQVGQWLPAGWMHDLVADGIIGGVGAVIVFLPNILILYFFISILEDSGYLARAALLFDPILRRVGLHGKSFFPMLTGFGCNVPAVMATRTIENRKSRLITMLTLPFMSCSARLPVYTIFTAAFFPQQATTVMFALYLFGILTAVLCAWVISRLYQPHDESHFVMEIPPYRMPVAVSVFRHTWEKGRQYLRKMGGLILVASIVVWVLGYFPRGGHHLTDAQQQEQSYLGRAGHAIQPIIAPLGFDWRMGVGILTGAMAKELMVSTLGVLYDVPADLAAAAGSGTDIEADTALATALRHHTTPPAALAYIVFALLYFPCLATLAAIRGETGRWRYTLFAAGYSTLLAYLIAWLVFVVASW